MSVLQVIENLQSDPVPVLSFVGYYLFRFALRTIALFIFKTDDRIDEIRIGSSFRMKRSTGPPGEEDSLKE